MKKLIIPLLFSGLMISGSCTLIVLNNEIQSGHSPMMRLDGSWNIDRNTEESNGKLVENADAGGVWFKATKDKGGYCEGTWMEAKPTVKEEFRWGIDKKGSEFYFLDNQKGEIAWTVLEQSKKKFVIEREENGVKYHMSLSR